MFNPDLHLPADPSTENLAHLDQRMHDAEASHFVLLVSTLGVVLHTVARGWWVAAVWTLLFDVLVNGYPVMLQRYNRNLLSKRFNLARTTQRRVDEDVASPTRSAAVRRSRWRVGVRRRPRHVGLLSDGEGGEQHVVSDQVGQSGPFQRNSQVAFAARARRTPTAARSL